jgi:PAS domain S-box-containing protein
VLDQAARKSKQPTVWHYVITVLMVAGAVGLRLAFNPILGKHSPFMLFPIVVLVAARFGGWLPGLLTAILTTFAGWYFLTDPPYSFYIADKDDAESVAVYAISATVISLLGAQVHSTLLVKTRSEATARQSESLVRALLDSAAQAILAVNGDGEIVIANAMTETTFGYKRRELLHQPLDLLIPEGFKQPHRELVKYYFAEPRTRPMGGFEVKGRHKSGANIPIEVGLSHIHTVAGTLAIAFVTDITQRRHVEQERQKFVSLAERSSEFIGMCDLDLKPFYINSAGMRLVGLENLDAACSFHVRDYFFPEDRRFITGEFWPRVRRDGHGKVEVRFRHFKTGEPIWMLFNLFTICDASGAVVAWATVSVDLTERKRTERALEESRQELRALAGRLINAEEEARKRISRELHDDLCQKLAILAFDASGALHVRGDEPAELKQVLADLQSRVVHLSHDVRQIAHELHPSVLDDLGLTAALRELCEEFSARERIELHFEESNMPARIPGETASCLYRITQEALHNVSRHAQARQVQIALQRRANGLCLKIADNGAGFDPQSISRRSLGLVSMKERVRMIRGEFSLQSQPGRGTEITVLAPLPKEES